MTIGVTCRVRDRRGLDFVEAAIEDHSGWGNDPTSRLKQRSRKKHVDRDFFVLAACGSEDKDKMFFWLEKAYADRSTAMTCLKVNPCYDPIRSDPRFQDLLRRRNFPPSAVYVSK